MTSTRTSRGRRAFGLLLTCLLLVPFAHAEDEAQADPASVVIEVLDTQGAPRPNQVVRLFEVEPLTPLRAFTRLAGRTFEPGDPEDFAPPVPAVGGTPERITYHETDAKGRVTVRLATGLRGVAEVDATSSHTGGVALIGRGPARKPRVSIFVEKGRRVAGRLRAPGGAPVAGYVRIDHAQTRCSYASQLGSARPRAASAQRTDAQGRFTAVVPANGACVVTAVVPGRFVRRGLVVLPDERGRLRVPMGAAGTGSIAGTVTDLDGKPLAGVRVRAHVVPLSPRDGTAPHRVLARTDEQGRYKLTGFVPGTVTDMDMGHEAHVAVRLAQLALPTETGSAHRIDARLQRGATLEGRVTDVQGNPVAGARVQAWSGFIQRFRRAFGVPFDRTDGNGWYTLESVPLGNGTLVVHASDEDDRLATAMILSDSGARRSVPSISAGISYHLQQQDERRRHDTELPAGTPVAGWVQTPDGTPRPYELVTATFVRALDPNGPPPRRTSWRTVADAAGRFRFASIPYGLRVRIGTSRTRAGSTTPFLELRPGRPVPPVTVTVLRGATLRGTVRDTEGNPVPYAGVLSGGFRNTTADALGRYEVRGVPAGRHALLTAIPLPGESPPTVTVEGPGTLENLDLVCAGTATIAGRLVDRNGDPVAGVSVSLKRVRLSTGQPSGLVTGRDGRFTVTQAPTGTHVVEAGGATGKVRVLPNGKQAEDLVLTTKPPTARLVRGEVFGPDGRHVPFGILRARRAEARGSHEVSIVAGRFTLPKWLAEGGGAVELVVTSALDYAGRPLAYEPAVVVSRRTARRKPLRVDLKPGRVLTGRALDQDGKPAAGVRLQLFVSSKAWWGRLLRIRTRSDAAGRFRFSGFPRAFERADIRLIPDEHFAPLEPVPVEGEALDDVSITVARAAALRGTVVDASGMPQQNVRVTVWAPPADVPAGTPAPAHKVETDAAGRFEVKGLNPGVRWWIRATKTGPSRVRYLVTMREGVPVGKQPIRLVLERAVSIRGRVELPRGDTIDTFGVEAKPADSTKPLSQRSTRSRGGTTDFELHELRAGRYRVTVDPWPDFKRPAPVVVDAPAVDVVIPLERAYPLRGRMVGAGHRRGRIWYYSEPVDRRGVKPTHTTTDVDGTFVVPNEVDGRGTILLRLGTELAAVARDVHPDEGPFRLEPQPTVEVTGTLENMPDVLWRRRRSILLRLGKLTLSTQLKKDGTFSFKQVPQGTWRVALPLKGLTGDDRLDGRIEGTTEYRTGTGPIRVRYVDK